MSTNNVIGAGGIIYRDSGESDNQTPIIQNSLFWVVQSLEG